MIDESTFKKMKDEGAGLFDNGYFIETGLLKRGKHVGKFMSLLEFRYKETFDTFFDEDRSKITKHARTKTTIIGSSWFDRKLRLLWMNGHFFCHSSSSSTTMTITTTSFCCRW